MYYRYYGIKWNTYYSTILKNELLMHTKKYVEAVYDGSHL